MDEKFRHTVQDCNIKFHLWHDWTSFSWTYMYSPPTLPTQTHTHTCTQTADSWTLYALVENTVHCLTFHITVLMPERHITQPFSQLSVLFGAGLDPHLSWSLKRLGSAFSADVYPYFICWLECFFLAAGVTKSVGYSLIIIMSNMTSHYHHLMLSVAMFQCSIVIFQIQVWKTIVQVSFCSTKMTHVVMNMYRSKSKCGNVFF